MSQLCCAVRNARLRYVSDVARLPGAHRFRARAAVHCCAQSAAAAIRAASGPPSLLYPGEEKHLRNIRQLTFGGQNAEAYFSADDRMLSFQHQGEGVPCDQIYTMPVDTPDGKPATPKLVSTGKGRTTCSYIFPSGDRILYSSTHAASPECPPKPDYSQGYVWPIYEHLQDLHRQARRQRHAAADRRARLQRRVHHQPRRQAHRLHLHAQRRSRHLHHERRRQRT